MFTQSMVAPMDAPVTTLPSPWAPDSANWSAAPSFVDVDNTGSRLLELRRERETLRVFSHLRDIGVRPIMLDGLPQAAGQAVDPHASADLEMLVAPNERRAAEAALASLGYARTREAGVVAWRGSGLWPVVLHKTFGPVNIKPAPAWAVVNRHRMTLPCARGSADTLDQPGRLVHLALRAGTSEFGPRDLRILAAELTDRHEFRTVELARNLGVTDEVKQALTAVGRLDLATWFLGWDV
ncbi:MAG: hypothetical protein Q4F67_09535 [Propionibacteriaceae bacterium]|nr:hypothetical protein [Propionibacteriaceae bacterium]